MSVRRSLWCAVALALPALTSDCGGERDAPEARLQALFPAHARRLLAPAAPEAAPVVTSEGFSLRGRASPARAGAAAEPIEAALSSRGDGAMRLRLPGFEARVTEEGLGGRGSLRGGAVLYPRAAGASLWRRGPAGCEEWVLLEAGTPGDDAPAAVWHVEGATLAPRGHEIALRDAMGKDRVTVRAPVAFTETGTPVALRLEVRGESIALFAAPAAEPVLIDPEWLPVAPMTTTYDGGEAVALADGRVLVTAYDNADVYDEPANTWTATGAMLNAHDGGAATLLADGRVMVSGGLDATANPTMAVELYTPATNTWAATGNLSVPRWNHTATLLPDGKVLVAGGLGDTSTDYYASAELYDPATATWTDTGTMMATRSGHFAALLATGKVMVGGGLINEQMTELYDVTTGTWAPAAVMVIDATPAGQVVLQPSGELLVVGDAVDSEPAALYDPTADTWSMTGPLVVGRVDFTATALASSSVLVAGGFDGATYLAEAETYDPVANTWSATASMTHARAMHTATRLPSGSVLVAGGFDGTAILGTAEVYNPTATGTGGGTASSSSSAASSSSTAASSSSSGAASTAASSSSAASSGGAGGNGTSSSGVSSSGVSSSGGASGGGAGGDGASSGSRSASSSGGTVGTTGGCGCVVAEGSGLSGSWAGAMLLLLAARRRRGKDGG